MCGGLLLRLSRRMAEHSCPYRLSLISAFALTLTPSVACAALLVKDVLTRALVAGLNQLQAIPCCFQQANKCEDTHIAFGQCSMRATVERETPARLASAAWRSFASPRACFSISETSHREVICSSWASKIGAIPETVALGLHSGRHGSYERAVSSLSQLARRYWSASCCTMPSSLRASNTA